MSEEKNMPPENSEKNEHSSSDNRQSVASASEPGTSTQQQTTSEPQPSNMEVHKHPHGVTHTKRWAEYMLEFLMIFLAVTLGFLAENQREHIQDHKRERQFIRSICKDLVSDTVQLHNINKQRERNTLRIDSLLNYLYTPDPDEYGKYIYYFARNILNRNLFYSNDRTIQQLKNAGNLRLIQNQEVSDSIMRYDWYVRRNDAIKEREEAFMMTYIEAMKRVFDGRDLDKMKTIQLTPFPAWAAPEGNPHLLRKDKESIQALVNNLHFVKTINTFSIGWNGDIVNRASKLLKQLKTEYDLENE